MAAMKKVIKECKGKKCDYCDDFAVYKIPDQGVYTYLCENCYSNPDEAKNRINEEL